jgi:hypothetical protein
MIRRVMLLVLLSACADDVSSDAAPPPGRRSSALLRGRSNFVGVFAPETATWKLKLQRPGWADEPQTQDLVFNFGTPGSLPVVGDWNGDGTQTPGTWQAGVWSLSNTLGGGVDVSFVYGATGDTPLVGDWDGDGDATPGLFRDGQFRLRNESSAGAADLSFRFGTTGDLPVVGDWDGDGTDTVGVYRPSDSSFHLIDRHEGGATQRSHAFAIAGVAQPVIGDWDEDGESTIGLRTGSSWRLRNHNSLQHQGRPLGELSVEHGEAGELPVVGNWRPDASRAYATIPLDFFPLAADYQPAKDLQKWKDRGLNTAVRVPVDEDLEAWTAEANRLGLKMIREPRPNPVDDNREANLIAFTIKDEPEVDVFLGKPDPYERLAGVAASLRAPELVQRPVFMNFAGTFMLDPGELFHGPGDSGPDWYSRFIALEDWVSLDLYPFGQVQARWQLSEQDGMDALPLAIDKLRRWAPNKPLFAYIESSQSDARRDAPPLKANHFKAQVWDAIVHGARGIFYFSHGNCMLDCPDPDFTPPDVVQEMVTQNARITALAKVLQGPINPASFAVAAAQPIDVGWRDASGERYVIAVNYAARPAQRWIRVSGLRLPMTVEVLDENRSVQPTDDSTFEDEFEPYGVHIYRFR